MWSLYLVLSGRFCGCSFVSFSLKRSSSTSFLFPPVRLFFLFTLSAHSLLHPPPHSSLLHSLPSVDCLRFFLSPLVDILTLLSSSAFLPAPLLIASAHCLCPLTHRLRSSTRHHPRFSLCRFRDSYRGYSRPRECVRGKKRYGPVFLCSGFSISPPGLGSRASQKCPVPPLTASVCVQLSFILAAGFLPSLHLSPFAPGTLSCPRFSLSCPFSNGCSGPTTGL